MIRQYFTHHRRDGCNPLGVSIIPVGAVFHIQDAGWWRERHRGSHRGAPIRRNPWIVEGFLNGILAAARRNPGTGFWRDMCLARRSDTAIVRSLRDGWRNRIVVRVLILHEENGLTAQPSPTPTCRTFGSTGAGQVSGTRSLVPVIRRLAPRAAASPQACNAYRNAIASQRWRAQTCPAR